MELVSKGKTGDPIAVAQPPAYHDRLQRLDVQEKGWLEVEERLRCIVTLLCMGARGMDARLDGELARLTLMMRSSPAIDELDPVLRSLTEAIAALGATPRHAPAAAHDHQRGALSAAIAIGGLLEKIGLSPELRAEAARLRQQFERLPLGEGPRGQAIHQVAELVNRQIAELRRERAEVESLLCQVTERLGEIAVHLTREADQRRATLASSRGLDVKMQDELKALDSSVRQARELVGLKQQVSDRLESIGSHLREFRQQETARLEAEDLQAQRMQRRIVELEKSTRSLQDSLEKERRAALTDTLTGIANRLAYQERIDQEFARWKRSKRPLCLAVWDVDHFKKINDRFGHDAGDRALRIVARTLAKGVRETDLVARYGGEEFVMVLEGSSPEECLRLAEKQRGAIGELGFHYNGQPVPLTVSCGIAAFNDADTPQSVFVRADAALYVAKQGGRNRCVLD